MGRQGNSLINSKERSVMSVKIYHNPRCSKCRQTMALLDEKGVTPEVIEYLETPPSEAELKEIIEMLGIKPRDLMRKGEKIYKELELSDDQPARPRPHHGHGQPPATDRAPHRHQRRQSRHRPPAKTGAGYFVGQTYRTQYAGRGVYLVLKLHASPPARKALAGFRPCGQHPCTGSSKEPAPCIPCFGNRHRAAFI